VSAGSLPTPWRRNGESRPLVAWREAQLSALGRTLESALQAWCQAWGLPLVAQGVTCDPASAEHSEGAWQSAGAAGAGSVWLALPSSFEQKLAEALWGSDATMGPIARRIAQACSTDWHERLRAALGVVAPDSAAPARPKAAGPWSGLVYVSLPADARLLLDAAAVEHALRCCAAEVPRPVAAPAAMDTLAPVSTALAALRLVLQAGLADCELDLASLQDLRIGDVVPLPHRLDAPLLVRDAQEQVVFAGYLARAGGRKALELARPAALQPD
jgi:hypothetical protein